MPIEVTRTADPAEAAQIVARDPSAYVLGGGTGLLRRIHEGDQKVRHLLRLSLPRMSQITPDAGGLFIGAQVTMSAILRATEAKDLHKPAASVGAPALRNMATVGGNLFARPPYGDLTTALLALGAEAVVRTSVGEDRQPLERLLRARRARVLVLGVVLPDRGHARFDYVKMTRSHPRGASIVTVATCITQTGGRIAAARIAFGGLAGAPIRATGAERALTNRALSQDSITAACARIGDGITPMSDALASGWYRLEMAQLQLKRLLSDSGGITP